MHALTEEQETAQEVKAEISFKSPYQLQVRLIGDSSNMVTAREFIKSNNKNNSYRFSVVVKCMDEPGDFTVIIANDTPIE